MAFGAAVLRGHGTGGGAAQRRQLQRVDRMRRGMAGGVEKGWVPSGKSYKKLLKMAIYRYL